MSNSASAKPASAKPNDVAPTPRLFDAEALGMSFEQLAIDVVKGETTDFMSRWYRARVGEADLVIWTDGEKRIIKHQLCFYGQIVDWNPINGTRTGLVVEEEVAQSATTPDVSEIIRFDRALQNTVVEQAIEVMSRIPGLGDGDRSAMIFNLRQSPRLHARARERALKVWAPKVDEITSSHRPPFWKRLRQWVLGD